VHYEDVQLRLTARPVDDSLEPRWTLEGENGKLFQVGRFSNPSLRHLADMTAVQDGSQVLSGSLVVRNIVGDVSAFHADPENRYATFQVASQFNCLEAVGPKMRPEYGVTDYVYDRTQGPACCIAAGPATVFRNYFVTVDGEVGQRAHRQINNLRPLQRRLCGDQAEEEAFFKVVGGYTLATDEGLQRMNTKLASLTTTERRALIEELCVGVHEDVQVTSSSWGQRQVHDNGQSVTQVLGSACSVSYSGNAHKLWEPFARLVLEASYEATFRIAMLTALRHNGKAGSSRLFLTCLGGGVFGNRLDWIVDAMEAAMRKFRRVNLEVCLVTYGEPVPTKLKILEETFAEPCAEPFVEPLAESFTDPPKQVGCLFPLCGSSVWGCFE